jgi:hypothetical protein
MSLKAFHVVFIFASILLAFGFAVWSLMNFSDGGRTSDLIYGVASALAGVGLIAYGVYVLKKLKHISYL